MFGYKQPSAGHAVSEREKSTPISGRGDRYDRLPVPDLLFGSIAWINMLSRVLSADSFCHE